MTLYLIFINIEMVFFLNLLSYNRCNFCRAKSTSAGQKPLTPPPPPNEIMLVSPLYTRNELHMILWPSYHTNHCHSENNARINFNRQNPKIFQQNIMQDLRAFGKRHCRVYMQNMIFTYGTVFENLFGVREHTLQ